MFKVAICLITFVIACFAVLTIAGEALSPGPRRFSEDLTIAGPTTYGQEQVRLLNRLRWVTAAALRGDLLANIAIAQAAPVLNQQKPQQASTVTGMRASALDTARLSLLFAPHSSRAWLLVALLQKLGPTHESAAEALKMSYLTSPADMDMIPVRLAASAARPTIDAELTDLVRADILFILTRHPELKTAIINAYNVGSVQGRTMIYDLVKSLDADFAASLL